MRSEWPRKHLAEISEVITGFPFKGEKYLPPKHGVRVVRGDNVTERYLRWGEKEKCWSGVTADLKPYVLRSGDVVIGMDGSKVGKNFAAISPDDEGSLLAQRVARLRAREGISQDYLRYVICNDSFTEYVKAVHTGTSIPHISKGQIENFEVVVPPFEDQQQIAAVLISLDDRITLLRETNATLEAIAQALFKSWFVDFDPVRAKMEGRTPEGMDEATAALFPDGFETSELGEVPRGWRYSTVGESFVLTMGQSPPGDTYNDSGEGLAFYQGRTDFGFRFPTQRVFCSAPTRYAEPGDTLVSVRAPVGDVNMALERCCIGRGVASVRHSSGFRGFVFYAMHGLRERFKTFDSEGTVFGSISKKDFQSLPVVVAPEDVLRAYDAVAAPIDQRIAENEVMLRTLSTLRDTLLPRLISGQLRLPEAQAATEAALGGTLSV